MLGYLDDQNFVEFVLERGSIPFIVRGSLTCSSNFNFRSLMKVRISGPTYNIRAIAENKKQSDDIARIHVHELLDEVVFWGEIELPEKTPIGIAKAISALELWADFMCLASGNPKIIVEIQRPINPVISVQRNFELHTLDKWGDLFGYYLELEKGKRKRIASAIWWYRKACNAAYYSAFDSYTAHWNCLEILCNVAGSKVNHGEAVDKKVQDYFKTKKKITAGRVLECYNKFVSYSIKEQMKDALATMLGSEEASQVIYQCFEIKPEKDRLYQVRNDINHGNIRENSGLDYRRVYFRKMLLSHITITLLHKELGYPLSKRESVNDIADYLQKEGLFRGN